MMFLSDSAPASHCRRHCQWLQRLAWLCAVMVLVITSLSAYIRLSKASLDCPPSELQRQCDTQAGSLPQMPDPALSLARMAHRVIASSALLVVLTLGAMAWRWRLKAQTRMALGLAVLALFLAALGRWTGQSPSAIVMLGNVLGGFVMFALSVCLADSLRQPRIAPAPTSPGRAAAQELIFPAAWFAVGVWVLVQTGLGVLSAQIDFPVLHRVSGLMLALTFTVLVWLSSKSPPTPTVAGGAGAAVARPVLALAWALPWVSVLSGLTAIALKQPVAWVLLHNLSAALLLSAIFFIALRAWCLSSFSQCGVDGIKPENAGDQNSFISLPRRFRSAVKPLVK